MSPRRTPPGAVVVDAHGKLAGRLNAAAARLWGSARRMAAATRAPDEPRDDLDFNALSGAVQGLLAQARRRDLAEEAVIMALAAAMGPLVATLPAEERARWTERLAQAVQVSAAMTVLAQRAPARCEPVQLELIP